MPDQPAMDYQAILAELEAEQGRIEAAIAYFRVKLGHRAGTAGTGQSGSPALDHSGSIRSDAFFRMAIPDAIKKYLGIMKKPQTATAITKGLQNGGLITTSKNFYGNVYTALKRLREAGSVVKVEGTSTWGLAEWYPNKPKGNELGKKRRKKKRKKRSKTDEPKETTSHTTAAGSLSWPAYAGKRRKEGVTFKEAAAEWKKLKGKS